MPVVVQMTFDLPAPADEFRDSVRQQAPMFNSVDGLRWKMWLVNKDEGCGTGIYMFESREQAKAYLDGEIVAGARLQIPSLQGKIYEIIEEPSRITHAPL